MRDSEAAHYDFSRAKVAWSQVIGKMRGSSEAEKGEIDSDCGYRAKSLPTPPYALRQSESGERRENPSHSFWLIIDMRFERLHETVSERDLSGSR